MNSEKIVSFHTSRCNLNCPNARSCYHIQRENNGAGKLYQRPLNDAIKAGHEIHIAVCNIQEAQKYVGYVRDYENVHMTVACDIYELMKKRKDKVPERIAVTCYFMQEIIDVGQERQKLYLIKDEASFIIARWMLQDGTIKNVHLPIDQNWIRNNKDKFLEIVDAWTSSDEASITIDSCVENYLLYGKCSYVEDYIDINYDDTVRHCPFEPKGVDGSRMSLDKMFEIEYKPTCIYEELFGGD